MHICVYLYLSLSLYIYIYIPRSGSRRARLLGANDSVSNFGVQGCGV